MFIIFAAKYAQVTVVIILTKWIVLVKDIRPSLFRFQALNILQDGISQTGFCRLGSLEGWFIYSLHLLLASAINAGLIRESVLFLRIAYI